jgi:hypothetical protein
LNGDVLIVDRTHQRHELAERVTTDPVAGCVLIEGHKIDAAETTHRTVEAIVAEFVPSCLKVARPDRPFASIGSLDEVLLLRLEELCGVGLFLDQIGEEVVRALPL